MQRFDLDGCAELMHASPDPLMRAVRYPIEECRRILEWSAGRRGRFAPDLAGVAIGPSGRVSGFVTVNPSGVIGQVYIDRTARRQGLARFLVERGLRGLAGRSVDRAILTAIEGNAPAQALYRSIGFEEIYRYPVRYWKDSGEPR
jgi:ribosomal protein S18 acetylase RimI-like enzyme